jgi:hypothetical protein
MLDEFVELSEELLFPEELVELSVLLTVVLELEVVELLVVFALVLLSVETVSLEEELVELSVVSLSLRLPPLLVELPVVSFEALVELVVVLLATTVELELGLTELVFPNGKSTPVITSFLVTGSKVALVTFPTGSTYL